MVRMSALRAFFAQSLDGFLAGEDDDLSWLPQPSDAAGDAGFGAFLEQTGALLMGRRTYDVVRGFDGPWPYGERPIVVATTRPLPPGPPGVCARAASIAELVAEAKALARGRDVYLDGGGLLRQAIDACLLDELTVTIVPIVLGRGVPAFAGAHARCPLELCRSQALHSGMMQLTYRPAR